ncbi:DUF456 domain-containing protein [Actinacidiphila soli]|jgi:uncharacterized protein YqgC (DUF456 family)|uniref:DUF456 domain-containing protein n=1 Tax=Actinacidiphila soli TaxID=2487275 RepID=UPI000FCB44E7|nr:DUF456 domain-containing protein [Actinacidiphila soli]
MGTAQLCLVGAVMLLGLLGVLVPGVPGPLLCWAAVLWWATNQHTTLSWGILAATTGVLLLNLVLKWLLPTRSIRAAGVSWRALFVAWAAAVGGFFVVPVVGALLGFVVGLYVFERVRLGSHGGAWVSTRTAMRAIGLGILIELFACLLVAGAWLSAVIAG